ncbi:MAG: SDR family NAD(P)-dependent oxidoreductase [Proteobacteria bacterium]|nr:SDR family NAD(P)-dependent oxidoreductase [Pseudomonadota bacterium]
MSAFAIDLAASRAFAELSGDRNPLHVDPEAARRTTFGGTVCHGVHVALAALDRVLADADGGIAGFRARFVRPVNTGSTVAPGAVASNPDGSREFAILADGETAVAVKFVPAPAPASRAVPGAVAPAPAAPAELDFDAAATASGAESAGFDPLLAARLFPVLAVRAPALLGVALAATRVVGMRCPGLHSLFVSLDVQAGGTAPASLDWKTRRASKALSILSIELVGDGVTAKIEALLRPRPRDQADFAAVRAHVTAGAFAGRDALVVGGSRGLGETAAKILAAGGAKVAIGYRIGVADAERVAREIREGGGTARTVAFDVLDPPDGALEGVNRLYYFAAPRIAPNPGAWRATLFAGFARHFVDGLAATLAKFDGRRIGVFYPSTCFLDAPEPGFAEYCAAKAAGETLLAQLAAAGRIVYAAPRLPRLATDQTVAFAHQRIDAAEPLDVLPAAILRAELES